MLKTVFTRHAVERVELHRQESLLQKHKLACASESLRRKKPKLIENVVFGSAAAVGLMFWSRGRVSKKKANISEAKIIEIRTKADSTSAALLRKTSTILSAVKLAAEVNSAITPSFTADSSSEQTAKPQPETDSVALQQNR